MKSAFPPDRAVETQQVRRPMIIAVTSFALWLTGCSTSSLFDSDTPPPSNYVLAPVPPASTATVAAASAVDLAISRPDVGAGLDTRRIAVLRGRQLDYFRRNEWGGSVTEIVQLLLVASLEDQKLFHSVTSEQTRVSSEYLLDVEVRDFQAEYLDGNPVPQVRVTMIGRLIRIADREMISTVNATALRSAKDNRMSEVAAAFEAAAQAVAADLAGKTAQAVNTDQALPSSPARKSG